MALGSMVQTAVDVVKLLEAEGISATLINARFAMPFDKKAIKELPSEHSLLVTMEDVYKRQGTANAIYQNIAFIERYDPEYVIILSGDQICKLII